MSDHDPLCPSSPANSPELKWCDCDFINMVRADEREQAAQRVDAIAIPLLDPPPCATCRHDAALHINGTNQCGYRVDGEYRCVCDGYQVTP